MSPPAGDTQEQHVRITYSGFVFNKKTLNTVWTVYIDNEEVNCAVCSVLIRFIISLFVLTLLTVNGPNEADW